MKHISILVPAGRTVVDTVIAPFNLLRMANKYHKHLNQRDEALYEIELVGLTREPVTYQNIFQLTPNKSIDEVERTDLVVVSAIDGNLEKELEINQDFIPWIRKQRIEHHAELASLCKGAILLAETGLLTDKACATHWSVHNFFQKRFPKVKLMPDKIISEDNGIYSSGGAYSFLNFTLYLIEKLFGRETAIYISKMSEVDMDRMDQSPFIIFNGQKDHDDEQIKEAQTFIEKNFEDKINIDEVAGKVNISPRSFLRRFKKATANTPLEYVQRVKTEAAKKRLESTILTIQEIMFSVGYNDEKAFRNTFRKYTGLSPLDYRKKYNREMALA